MTWNTNRSERLPKDWAQRRAHIINRAHGQCEAHLHNGTRCTAPGTDVDHITHGDNHDLTNLQLLCTWHHKQKTRTEAAAELAARQARNTPPRRPHPGLKEGRGDPAPGVAGSL